MTSLAQWVARTSLAAMLLGCGNAPADGEVWGEDRQALNACNETVPESRAIDGIPAYAQCDGVATGAIWSNNGVDTAPASQGEGWVRTQYSGGYQCTELARRYMLFRFGIDYQHGNAGQWCDGDLPSTLTIASQPTHGDLIVFAPGSCGADATTGHVAVVDTVDMAGGKVTIVEQNRASRRSTQQSCAKCFLHAVANNGSGGSGGAAQGGAAQGGAAQGGAGGAAQGGAAQGGAGGAATDGAASGGATTGGLTSNGGASQGGENGGATAGKPLNEGSAGSSRAEPGSAVAGSAPASGVARPGLDDPQSESGCSIAPAASGGRSFTALMAACALLVARRRRGQNAR